MVIRGLFNVFPPDYASLSSNWENKVALILGNMFIKAFNLKPKK